MKSSTKYRIPSRLTRFQRGMYEHLIEWKWRHITTEVGYCTYKARLIPYDAILPASEANKLRLVYEPVRSELRKHLEESPFRIHRHFDHMASSQAANVNLFLPLIVHGHADDLLRALKPDLESIARPYLHKGYRIEFWDDWNAPRGRLGDKNEVSGTDADIAIAYYNHKGELCLWLIEHKLTEKEFTTCGGFRSKCKRPRHNCSKSFTDILKDKSTCYCHDVRKYNWWTITEANRAFFVNHARHAQCPFHKGMNQLWRNQLLALSIERDDRQPFKHVSFSVVKHPQNTHLDQSLREYKELIADNPKFSVFTSADVIDAASKFGDESLAKWVNWYKELYAV